MLLKWFASMNAGMDGYITFHWVLTIGKFCMDFEIAVHLVNTSLV